MGEVNLPTGKKVVLPEKASVEEESVQLVLEPRLREASGKGT